MKPPVFNYAEFEALKAECERLKRWENTILTADHTHRYAERGLHGLLEQIKELKQVCLEHQQERMELIERAEEALKGVTA